jgi:hypothetical protein
MKTNWFYDINENLFFDKKGKQILEGDLLKVFHFRTRSKIYYTYNVVVKVQNEKGEFFMIKDYSADKPHCLLWVAASNSERIFKKAEIIAGDWQAKRKRIKINKEETA